MRSESLIKQGSTISLGLKKRCVYLFFIACSLACCPNFALLAETLSSNINNDLSSSSSPSFPISPNTSRTKIYFYNPEINSARNLVLKSTWDNYLYEFGFYEFQPIDSRDAFTKLVRNEKDAAFIMAEWLYSSFFSDKENRLELAFKGSMNGEDTYQKILVSHNNSIDLEKVTIACSGSKERAKEVLHSIYPELSALQIAKIKILIVPKDIDAVMAVGYGLAEMALTTELGLSRMALMNENVYKGMIVLKASKPISRSVLVFKSSNVELKAGLAHALKNMSNHESGQKAINLLGLDEWQMVDSLSRVFPKKRMEDTHNDGGQNHVK
jgi:hypothetical protein